MWLCANDLLNIMCQLQKNKNELLENKHFKMVTLFQFLNTRP